MNGAQAHAYLDHSGAIAQNVAHDLNNILTVILGNISLAMGFNGTQDRPGKSLAKAEQAALKARDLAYQLSRYGRFGTAKKKTTHVSKLLSEVRKVAETLSQVRVNTDIPEDVWWVKADVEQISQVLQNLVIESLQEIPWGGEFNLCAENVVIDKNGAVPLRPGRYVKISLVRPDDDEVDWPDMTCPAEDDHRPGPEGFVFGLQTVHYLIKTIIAMNRGHLEAESAGKGCTFHLYLPACGKKGMRKPGAEIKPLKRKKRILVMDDDEMVRNNVGMILDFLGYEAEFAEEGSQALTLYARAREDRSPFDAVLLDLSIREGLGGRETVEKLLTMDPQAKALVFSGYLDNPLVTDYQDYGFRGIINKPCTVEDFDAALKSLLH